LSASLAPCTLYSVISSTSFICSRRGNWRAASTMEGLAIHEKLLQHWLQTAIAIENQLHLPSADRSAKRNVRTKHDVLNLPPILSIVVAMQKNSMVVERELPSNQEGDMPASSYASSPPNISKLTSQYYSLSLSQPLTESVGEGTEKRRRKTKAPNFPFVLSRRAQGATQKLCKGFTSLCFPFRLRQFNNRPGCPCNAE
jgi:hypothetical protein